MLLENRTELGLNGDVGICKIASVISPRTGRFNHGSYFVPVPPIQTALF